ncbi:MAG: exodeoxyribonuclease VII large subunit [Bacteroidota bacterium]|nr:exodeoxyribonuclease VII large subunit [Bacteroidota bacterium]
MQVTDAISLHKLNSRIKNTLREGFVMPVWVIAEINQFNPHRSGHCYLELIEKEAHGETIIATIRGTIWASSYNRISAFFKSSTGQDLRAGLKVMLKVQIDFHELYGISLNVRDIDPSYTLGDQARHRAEIIRELGKVGVLDMNKELEMVRVPQTIAVISSSSAAGYEDFCNQLVSNAGQYHFTWKLFHASMQGDQTSGSIIQALDRVAEYENIFDVVVVIRGGGSKTDLSYLDDYDLAYYITQFPMPIITGIGHERDDSVIDEVAHTRCKTPTAAAAFLIDQAELFESELEWLKDQITMKARNQLLEKRNRLIQLTHSIRLNTQSFTQAQKSSLREKAILTNSLSVRFIKHLSDPINQMEGNLSKISQYYLGFIETKQEHLIQRISHLFDKTIDKEKHRLDLLSREAEYLNPLNILKKGYSITYFNGKAIKDSSELNTGDKIVTLLKNGKLRSSVE